MLDPTSATPSPAVTGLCMFITACLVGAMPGARLVAGRRLGEEHEQTRRAAVRTGVVLLAWLAVTGTLAGTGALAHFDGFPPGPLPLFLLGFVLTVVVGLSRYGARLAEGLPLALIVGYQGFRVGVEIMLHAAYDGGVIGRQMTWSGLNFDVVTGLTGLALGIWLWRRGEDQPVPRALLWAWNGLGLALLVTIVTIAILSFPGPLARFDGPPNVWVATVPFVWLPSVMVTAALFGHVLLARRLLAAGRR